MNRINLEDLLPRNPIELDRKEIADYLRNKVVLITGAAGSIGSELSRQIAKYAPRLMILIDFAETPLHNLLLEMKKRFPELESIPILTSITDKRNLELVFGLYRPQVVFHAAAYKHVPMMESFPAKAVQNNCMGTRIVADLAVKFGVGKFVMISSDKAVNPTNVMGCSKRICEIYCQALDKSTGHQTQFVTTRFGNVLGSNGSVIPIFMEQLREGGPLTVTHPDIVRFFMLIPEACELVLQACTLGKGGEIFVFDMGRQVRIADLAQRMIDLSGLKGIEIVYTGLRNGEKLFEEVLNQEETTLPTTNPKIKVAKVREYEFGEVLRNELALEELSYHSGDFNIVRKMKDIVPEYKSMHSKYEILIHDEWHKGRKQVVPAGAVSLGLHRAGGGTAEGLCVFPVFCGHQ